MKHKLPKHCSKCGTHLKYGLGHSPMQFNPDTGEEMCTIDMRCPNAEGADTLHTLETYNVMMPVITANELIDNKGGQ